MKRTDVLQKMMELAKAIEEEDDEAASSIELQLYVSILDEASKGNDVTEAAILALYTRRWYFRR